MIERCVNLRMMIVVMKLVMIVIKNRRKNIKKSGNVYGLLAGVIKRVDMKGDNIESGDEWSEI